jgi:hypothetical protein
MCRSAVEKFSEGRHDVHREQFSEAQRDDHQERFWMSQQRFDNRQSHAALAMLADFFDELVRLFHARADPQCDQHQHDAEQEGQAPTRFMNDALSIERLISATKPVDSIGPTP